jgi:hypothetical protein
MVLRVRPIPLRSRSSAPFHPCGWVVARPRSDVGPPRKARIHLYGHFFCSPVVLIGLSAHVLLLRPCRPWTKGESLKPEEERCES